MLLRILLTLCLCLLPLTVKAATYGPQKYYEPTTPIVKSRLKPTRIGQKVDISEHEPAPPALLWALIPEPVLHEHYTNPYNHRVDCVPKSLLNIMFKVANEVHGTPNIYSGYRDPKHNKRVGGAKRSWHMKCKALDFWVAGVSPYTLAKLSRKYGAGGVGTYEGRSFIHIDLGPYRSWHYKKGLGKKKVVTAKKKKTYAKKKSKKKTYKKSKRQKHKVTVHKKKKHAKRVSRKHKYRKTRKWRRR